MRKVISRQAGWKSGLKLQGFLAGARNDIPLLSFRTPARGEESLMREQCSRHTRERTLAQLQGFLAGARNDIPLIVIPNPCKG